VYSFTLNTTFSLPTPQLFKAFHKTDYLILWFAPGQSRITQVMSSFTKNGRYRMRFQEVNGEEYSLLGEYMEILEDQNLQFSWAWEDTLEQSIITLVDIKFNALDSHTTTISLTHSGFANQAECDQHQLGWISCLEKLSTLALNPEAA
jgi:uncharacterized protein YndB with AHSA1/START domain